MDIQKYDFLRRVVTDPMRRKIHFMSQSQDHLRKRSTLQTEKPIYI